MFTNSLLLCHKCLKILVIKIVIFYGELVYFLFLNEGAVIGFEIFL
jgi:hypothetical protein